MRTSLSLHDHGDENVLKWKKHVALCNIPTFICVHCPSLRTVGEYIRKILLYRDYFCFNGDKNINHIHEHFQHAVAYIPAYFYIDMLL